MGRDAARLTIFQRSSGLLLADKTREEPMNRIFLSVGYLLLVMAVPISAQNLSFLTGAPVANLSDADQEILRETVRDALDNQPDGTTVEWLNPDTGSTGTIEVLDTHEDFGTTCRSVRTFTRAGGREGGGVHRLCKAEDDSWRFAPRRRQ